MSKLGILNGADGNKYKPNEFITREQAAKIFMTTAKYLGLKEQISKYRFYDDNIISSWAKEGVYYSSSNSIMNGTGNNCFSPQKHYSNEMCIATILRLYKLLVHTSQ